MTTLSFEEFFDTPQQDQPAAGTMPGQSEYDAEKMSNISQIQAQMVSYRRENKPNDRRLPILQDQLDQETNQLNDQAGKASILQQRAQYDRVSGQASVGPKTLSFDEFFGNQSGGAQPDEPSWANRLPVFGVSPQGELAGPPERLKPDSIRSVGQQDIDPTKPYIGYPKGMSKPITGYSKSMYWGKEMISDLAALADMISPISMASQITKEGIFAGKFLDYQLQGLDQDHASMLARHEADKSIPPAIIQPFNTIMEALGFGQDYSRSNVSKAMKVLSDGIEKGSDNLAKETGIPTEATQAIVNTTMNALGLRQFGKAYTKERAARSAADEMGAYDPSAPTPPPRQGRVEPTFTPEGPLEVNIVGGKDGPLPPEARAPTAEQGMYQNGTPAAIRVPGKPNLRPRSTPDQVRMIEEASNNGELLVKDSDGVLNYQPPDGRLMMPQFSHDLAYKLNMNGGIDPRLLETMGLASAVVAAGGWLYMHPEDAEKIGRAALAAAGALGGGALMAVKPTGGFWHPEAVTRLSQPLKDQMIRAIPGGIARRAEDIRAEFGREPTVEELTNKNDGGTVSQWADSRIRTYLNKHAGTEGDPLRDVKVPMMGEDVRWEDLTDQIIKGKPVRATHETIGPNEFSTAEFPPGTVKSGETVWDIPERRSATHRQLQAITSYLSHVGDVLREGVSSTPLDPATWFDTGKAPRNVRDQYPRPLNSNLDEMPQRQAIDAVNAWDSALEKTPEYHDYVAKNPMGDLTNYDLVRAVKLTEQVDLAAKLEMAKNRQAKLDASKKITSELPPSAKVKEYPDGSAWYKIDNTLPKDQIALNLSVDTELCALCVGGVDHGKWGYKGWVPARNIVTRKKAHPNAEDTNGYIDAVKSGEAQIYSLRDTNGEVGATIEVQPDTSFGTPETRFERNWPTFYDSLPQGLQSLLDKGANAEGNWTPGRLKRAHPDVWEMFKHDFENTLSKKPDDIIQIKGSENKSLVGTPFEGRVQDFVRSGPRPGEHWGEVGDLENTGLVRTQRGYEVKSDLIAKGEEWQGGGPGFEHWGPRNQRGNIDPKLLTRMAAVGIAGAIGTQLDPDHPILGGLKGLGVGLLLASINPRTAVNAIKNVVKPEQLIKIDNLRNWTEHMRKRAGRSLWQVQSTIEELAPKPAQQVKLTQAIRSGDTSNLTPKELSAFTKAKTFFNDMWQYASDQKVIDTFEQNYVTQLWGQPGKDLLRKLQESGGTGSGTTTKTPYSIKRTLTFDEGIALGLKPLTEDLSAIMGIYGNSVIKAVENKKFINVLKNTRDKATGDKLLMKDGSGVPRDYVSMDHPQLRNVRIHPDIAPDLKFIFDANDPNVIFRGLEALNTTQKRMAVSLSLFHAKALEDAMIGASKVAVSPGRFVKSLAQASMPRVFGENQLVKEIRTGGAGDLVDKAQKAGLEFSYQRRAPVLEEINQGFYEGMTAIQKIIDNSLPGVGKATVGNYIKLNHAFDNFMWGRLHAGLKLNLFAEKYATLLENNAKAHAKDPIKFPTKTDAEVANMAASFTNDIFGGLNWQRLAMEPSSRIGREVASAILSPGGRRFMRLALFAPDWTISTTRAFVKAYGMRGTLALVGSTMGLAASDDSLKGAAIGGLAGYGVSRLAGFKPAAGSGVKGLFKPTELADLHRQYIMRSAFWYIVVGDSINYTMTGHHLWENKDPTRIDLGDGRTMQWSKHTMEPIHWLTGPGQQALNKLGFIPKELSTQALHKEYLSTKSMPEMKGSRLGHAARAFSPISAQQAFETDEGGFDTAKAMSGFLGAPIYGRTEAQRQKFRENRKLERARARETKQ